MTEARVTQAGALVELDGDPTVVVTQAGALVELDGDPTVVVTQAGALVELDGDPTVVVTQAGALVEFEAVVTPPYRTAGNIALRYNGFDLAPYLADGAIAAAVAEAVTTVYASEGQEAIPTLAAWSQEIGGVWGKALDDALGMDSIFPPAGGRSFEAVIGPIFGQTRYYWSAGAFVSNYRIEIGVDDAIRWSGRLALPGAPQRS